jgi:zinc protease
MNRRYAFITTFVLLLAANAPISIADTPLPKDPNNTYGVLDNGLAYIIREHKNPPGRIALYLHIDTGALNETEKQNGLAHFLEHMAFNGSKNFAPDTLIPYMNKLGMEFGADSNASTDHIETIYKLFMPDAKDETIEKAMTIFGDFACGLTLSIEEIDKERHIILEESRAHKSARERLQKEWLKKVFAGTLLAVHDVIGDEKQIATFPREEFVQYWNNWYRPDQMTLIVVGEVKPEKVLPLAQKHLGQFKSRADKKPNQLAGIKPGDKPRAFVLTDKEQVMCQLQLLRIRPIRPPMKTYADYRTNEIENIGTWIVGRRLEELVNKGKASFRGAFTNVGALVSECLLPTAIAIGEPADWNKMLDQVAVEVNRAIEFGFTKREMKLARQQLIADAEQAVEQESTRDARTVVGLLTFSVGEDYPIISAQQRLDLLKKILDEVSAEQVHAMFKENFAGKDYTTVLQVPAASDKFTPPSDADLAAATAAAWAKKPEAPKEEKDVDTLLAKEPEPGKIVDHKADPDLKVTTATLSNGAICHHRFMDYKKDEVFVRMTLPGGQIEETADNRGVSEVAGQVFNQPATSRLESTQLRDLLTGKKVEFGGGFGQDALTITINGTPKDIEWGFQAVYAVLTDGKIEESAFDNWKKMRLQRLEMMEKMPEGQMIKNLQDTMFGGDVRFCEMTPAQIDKLTIAQGQQWLNRIARDASIEAAIVGDISLDDAMKLATKYFGGLPQRSKGDAGLETLRKISRGSGPFSKNVKFDSITDKAMVIAGFLGCDERNTPDRRLLVTAARILSDRMIKRLREAEQLVYGIGCQNQPARAIPGTGIIFAAAPTDPQNAEKLADTILSMMKDFAEKGATDEELDIAKKQIVNELDKSMKEPSFWVNQIGEMKYRSRPLAELKELPGCFEKFTAMQVQDVARKYIKPESAVRVVVVPKATAAAAKDVPGEKVKKKVAPAKS